MILIIKAKTCDKLPDGSLRIMTDCENFRESLKSHSPNLLIDYLNENFDTHIIHLPSKRKEANNGTV